MGVSRAESFYNIRDPLLKQAYRGKFAPHDVGAGLSRGEESFAGTVEVKWAMGDGVPGDCIWTTSAAPLIVHRRVIDLLRDGGFTGWSPYPIHVWSASGDLLHQYAGLIITGRCDRADLSRSRIVLRQMPGGWYPYFQGRYFPRGSSDGSDLFMERPDQLGKRTTNRFCTERVERALVGARVTNLRLTRSEEECVNTSVYQIGLQHLLPADFELQVARAYEEAGVERPPSV